MSATTTSDARRANFRRIADEVLEVIRLSSQVLDELCQGVGMFRLYDAKHGASVEAVRKVLGKVRSLFYNRRAITIDVGVRRFLVNGLPIYEAGKGSEELHAHFRKAGVGGLTFREGVDRKQISDFIRHLAGMVVKDRDRQWLQDMLKMSDVTYIRVEVPLLEDKAPNGETLVDEGAASGSLVQNARARLEEKTIEDPRKLYQVAVGMARDLLQRADEPEPINVKEVNRIAKNLIEMLNKKSSGLVAMAIAGRMEPYPFLHPVNVAIFGAHMAASLYQEKEQWIELARIAFLYDIGKGRIPQDIIYKNGPLSAEEREQLDQHPVYSADMLDRHADLDKLTVVVAYEHHLEEHAGQGEGWETNLFTRIIRVAEAFDAMIGNNIYRRTMTPHMAMKTLLREWESRPETPLLGRLIRAIGVYPAGSVVTLNTGEAGVVVRQNRKNLVHPEVQVLVDRTGRMLEKAEFRKTNDECFIDGVIPPDKAPFDPLRNFPF
jgi:HD-GYP domain-containing protein (c-di-GMP phosphodiesterase class II)